MSGPPRLLDLFSGAGGAAAGYAEAGFEVLGFDVEDQPRYPFAFKQADALDVLADVIAGRLDADAIHASPVCRGYSRMSRCRPGLAEKQARLIGVVRDLLRATRLPWVIENVEGAGLAGQDDLFGGYGVVLCACQFGRELYRARWFETSFPVPAGPPHPLHLKPGSAAGHWRPGTVISVAGNCSPVALAREVMGIGWTTREELRDAVPPYMTAWLGGFLRAEVEARGGPRAAP